MHRLVALPIVVALSIALAPLPLAALDPGPEIWVDGPEEEQPGVDPNFPDVAVDEAGRRIYVWKDFLGTSDRNDIYLRRFDAGGSPLESPQRVNTLTDDDQTWPRVAVAPDGSFLVVWQSREHDADVKNTRFWVRSQAFESDGSPMGSEQLLSELSSGEGVDIHADVAALRSSDGTSAGYVVVWMSKNSTADDTNRSIQGRRVSATGATIGSQFQVNSDSSPNQRHPAITELGDGGFLVVWVDPQELMGRRFDGVGAPEGPDFQISTAFSGQKIDPDAAIGSGDQVLVAWMDAEAGLEGREIRARLLEGDLTFQGPDFRVNTLTTDEQSGPRVADLGSAGFLVAWQSESSVGADGDASIQARVITGPDQFDGPQLQLNVYETGAQEFLGAFGRDGLAAVAWQSSGNDEVPVEPNITSRHIEICLFCDGFESGGTSRWSASTD